MSIWRLIAGPVQVGSSLGIMEDLSLSTALKSLEIICVDNRIKQ